MRRLTNSAYWEVNDQSPKAWQAYLESVMNRGIATHQSLDAIISSDNRQGGYYPGSTIDHLNDPLNKETQAFQSKLTPILNNVLRGSNVSSFCDRQSGRGP
jgi:hypothetical protein